MEYDNNNYAWYDSAGDGVTVYGIDDEFYMSNTDLDAKHNVTAPNHGAKISILRVAQWENGQARSRRMYIK